MKITYAMNILNAEPFIKYQLDSIYEHAHEIIIVEGAYKKFAHATNNCRSKDNTLNIIKAYHDNENKIKLVVNDHFYEDRMEMCNEFLKHVSGDVLWQVDSDEFYTAETHEYVYQLFKNDNELDMVSFNFNDYFASTDYCIAGNESLKLDDVNRVHRFNQGDQWKSQRPPILIDKNGKEKVIKKKIDGPSLKKKDHIMHHATMMFDDQIIDKYKYYNTMKFNVNKPTHWYVNVWQKLHNKFCIAGFKYNITYLKRNNKAVPADLLTMINDIRNNKISNFKLRETKDVRDFISSRSYEKYVQIAEEINKLPLSKKNLFSQISHTLKLLINTIYYIDHRTSKFGIKIICLNFLKFLRNKYLINR